MTKVKKPAGRSRIDWPAVKRDWRTSRFTQVELAKKHGIDPATLNRQIKKDKKADPSDWAQDLTKAVKDATDARLMAEMVKAEVKEGQDQVKDAVKIAAEVNTQIILAHRNRAKAAVDVAMRMLGELDFATMQTDKIEAAFDKITEELSGPSKNLAVQQFRDFMRLHARVGSVHKLMDALAKAQVLERQAFGLDEKAKPPGAEFEDLSDADLDARIEEKLRLLGK